MRTCAVHVCLSKKTAVQWQPWILQRLSREASGFFWLATGFCEATQFKIPVSVRDQSCTLFSTQEARQILEAYNMCCCPVVHRYWPCLRWLFGSWTERHIKKSKCPLNCALPGEQTVLFWLRKAHLLKWRFINYCSLWDQLMWPLTMFPNLCKEQLQRFKYLQQKVWEWRYFHYFLLK